MQKAVTLNQLEEMIIQEYERIPPERIFYTMKKMRLKRVYRETVETMRYSLALHKLGIFVTVHLIANLRGISYNRAIQLLHRLGDAKCLTLLRGGRRKMNRWIVSQVFLENYDWGETNSSEPAYSGRLTRKGMVEWA